MTLLALACIVLAAHTVETIMGFGSTVIALSLGAHLVPVRDLVPTLVLVGWIPSLWIFFRSYRRIQWRLLFRQILPFSALGFPLGMWCFRVLSAEHLKFVLGAFVTALAALEFLRISRAGSEAAPLKSPAGEILLASGGFFQGLMATGGPLIVYRVSREISEKGAFRGTLSVLWLTLNSVLITSFFVSGRMAAGGPALALSLLPAVFLGIFLGEVIHLRVNQGAFRVFVQIVLFLTGVSLLL